MTFRGLHFAAAVCLTCATSTHAAQWTWPDGKVALTLPDEGSLKRMKGSGPAIAAWESADGQVRIYMGARRNRAEVPLDPKELERDLAKPMTGSLIYTVRQDVGGIPSYTTSVRGNVKGKTRSIIQRVITFGGRTYLVRAEGPARHGSDALTAAAVRSLAMVMPEVSNVTLARSQPSAPGAAQPPILSGSIAAPPSVESVPVEVNTATPSEPLTDEQLGEMVGKAPIVGGLVAVILTLLTKKRPKPSRV